MRVQGRIRIAQRLPLINVLDGSVYAFVYVQREPIQRQDTPPSTTNRWDPKYEQDKDPSVRWRPTFEFILTDRNRV